MFVGLAMFGALTQLTDSQGFIQTQTVAKPQVVTQMPQLVTQKPCPPSNKFAPTAIKVDDPLRELVLCSSDKDADPEKLKFLALSAANLVKEEENAVSFTQASRSVKSLAGIFTGTETFVKKMEENLKKKYSALEPSDSEWFGGNNNILMCKIGNYFFLMCYRRAIIGKNFKDKASKISTFA